MARALEKGDTNPNIQYGAALTYWELGQTNEALDRLERAVKAGYPTVWLRDSAVFDAWRGMPRFQAIIGDSAQSANTASPKEGGS
jgi:L-amino acid N-acyltransferase YncA